MVIDSFNSSKNLQTTLSTTSVLIGERTSQGIFKKDTISSCFEKRNLATQRVSTHSEVKSSSLQNILGTKNIKK